MRQAYAGLLWSKQFYYYVVTGLAQGRPAPTQAAEGAEEGRNADWQHVFCRDVISMPDKWEYPWFAAWDLAFHVWSRWPSSTRRPSPKASCCCCSASGTCTRTGRLPAYEWAFDDVNPPVHAWACWRVYRSTGERGPPRHAVPGADLSEAAAELHLVGQPQGPQTGRTCSPAASWGWTTSACSTATSRCPPAARWNRPTARPGWRLLLRPCWPSRWSWPSTNPAYEDIASKFFEHFVAIVDATNTLGGTGLWDENGRLLLRPDLPGSARPRRSRCGRWWGSSRSSRWRT